jgi:O-acetylhomoserine/O-acetylserine sulfhydrylase-like pyridoxal-dependent enzyme
MRKSTELIHAGERVTSGVTPSLTTPIYETSTFVFESAAEVQAYQAGRSSGYLYSRYENPTVVAVEQTLAAVEGAERSLLFSSGQAATTHALLTLLQQGDEVVCSAAIYGGTHHLIADLLPRFGITGRFVTLDELSDPARVIGPRTKVVWFESPNNPTLRCVDVRAVAVACRQAGVTSAVDNTHLSAQPAGARDGRGHLDAERDGNAERPRVTAGVCLARASGSIRSRRRAA